MDLRKEIRRILLEWFEKPSEMIDKNLGTIVSHTYSYPPNVDRKTLEKFFDKIYKAQDSRLSFYQEEKLEKLKEKLAYLFVKQNPELSTLKHYVPYDAWHILNGVISGYNPDDILFFITHPGGYANPSIKNYVKKVHETFKKFPFTFSGGYLPSPKSFEKIKKSLEEKGIAENAVVN